MTPSAAVAMALAGEQDDDDEFCARLARQIVARVVARRGRLEYRAAVILCASEPHCDRERFGPCRPCRDAARREVAAL